VCECVSVHLRRRGWHGALTLPGLLQLSSSCSRWSGCWTRKCKVTPTYFVVSLSRNVGLGWECVARRQPGTMLDLPGRAGRCYGVHRIVPCVWHV
jgi:hypothetical protein